MGEPQPFRDGAVSTNLSGMTGAAEQVLRIGQEIITSRDDVVGSVSDT